MGNFDYTKDYEETARKVKAEVSAEFVGYAGNNVYAVALGHGDYSDLLKAFLFDVGITSMGPMVENLRNIKDFDDKPGLRYVYDSVKHKTAEEIFRKVLKEYRGYEVTLRKRYGLIQKEVSQTHKAPVEAKLKNF